MAESDGRDFIVMEYIDGQSLKDRLLQGPLPLEEELTIAIEVAEALEAAHAKGIIHRDIKPGNVMLTQTGHAKVMDFGLAKQLVPSGGMESAAETITALTSDGSTVGTLAYMSPEQLRSQAADVRSDIWALGVTVYEMASGARPFHGQSGFELTSAIMNQAPRPLPSQVPAELGAVIERCLEKEAGKRYQQVGEVRAALEAIRAGTAAPWAAWRYRLARRRRLAGLATLVLVAALVLGLDVGGLRGRLSRGGATPRIDSLAVLPLANLSGDPQQDYIAEGMHDALITNLAQLGDVKRVIARNSVMRFKATNTPLRTIAQELKVAALITGAVVRSGDRVRITAQLINPMTEAQLWAHSYERSLSNVLSLQNEIVAAITREVGLRLTPQDKARLASAPTVNPEAFEAYLKGRFYLNKLTPEDIKKGLSYLQQAIDKDPANPLPYAGLALGYCLIGHGPTPPPDAFARANAAALKAQELGGTLAETEAALGQIKLYSDWDWAGAEQAFRRALELNPSLPDAHRNYSWYLLMAGRRDESIAEMKRANEVDPLTPLWSSDLGWQYWSMGRYEEAIDAVRKSLELNPNFAQALCWLGAVYAEKGMYAEAIAAHQKASALGPSWRWPLVRTYVQAGRKDEARKMLAKLLGGESKPAGPFDAWFLVEIYATLFEKDEAFKWLGTAYKERNSLLPWVRVNPAYAPLRSDPRFQALLRKMNLPQ